MSPFVDVLLDAWRATALHLWQATIVIVAALVLVRRLDSAPARFVHGVWLVAFAKLLVPAALVGSWLRAWHVDATWSAGVADPIRAVLSPALSRGEPGSGPVLTVFVCAWTLVWLTVATLRLGHMVMAVRAHEPARYVCPSGTRERARLVRLARAAGIGPDRLRITSDAVTPHVRGLLQPYIVLPRWIFAALTPAELDAVVAHEGWHVRRRDPLRTFLQRLAAAVLWFYPLTGYVCRQLNRSSELVCDEAVLHRGISGRTLSRALARTIQQAWTMPVSSLAVRLDGDRFLSRRFRRLIDSREVHVTSRHWVVVGIVAVVTTLTTVVPLLADASDVRGRDKATAGENAGEFEVPPKPLHTVAPEYPKALRDEGIEGTVYVRATIDESGSVSETAIEVRKDVERAHPLFEEAALAAAAKWRFEPASLDGKPVSVSIVIPFKFALPNDGR